MQPKHDRSGQLNVHKLLVNRFAEYQDVLYEDTWTSRDMRVEEPSNTMLFLLSAGAVEKIGEKEVKDLSGHNKTQYLKVYTWLDYVQDELQHYHENREELPCGHRIHIYNPKNTDLFGCKYCDAEYTRESIEAVL